MASLKVFLVFGLVSLTAALLIPMAAAADADPLFDFNITGKDAQNAMNADFVFRGLEKVFKAQPRSGPGMRLASSANIDTFPVLSTQGISLTILNFGARGGQNPPHVHPRATEILICVKGELEVAVVDTSNKVFRNILYAGDVTVFPRGLAHFQVNNGKKPAVAVAALNSANPGTGVLDMALKALHAPKIY